VHDVMLYKHSTDKKNRALGKSRLSTKEEFTGIVDMSLNIHPPFSKEFITELGSATACVSSTAMLQMHCAAAAVKSSTELNGAGSMYIRQVRHPHGNTAHFTNCCFIT